MFLEDSPPALCIKSAHTGGGEDWGHRVGKTCLLEELSACLPAVETLRPVVLQNADIAHGSFNAYQNVIQRADEQIGRLLERVDLRETIVCVHADHGGEGGCGDGREESFASHGCGFLGVRCGYAFTLHESSSALGHESRMAWRTGSTWNVSSTPGRAARTLSAISPAVGLKPWML